MAIQTLPMQGVPMQGVPMHGVPVIHPQRTSIETVARPSLAGDQDWTALASCRDGDPDALFVQGAEQNRAKAQCRACPVRTECLADALDNRVEFGVWGGMTERERRALLRRRPEVGSWRDLLEQARNDHSNSRFGMAG